jgi:hypothetical protein
MFRIALEWILSIALVKQHMKVTFQNFSFETFLPAINPSFQLHKILNIPVGSTMTPWTHLIRFIAAEDGYAYYATCTTTLPQAGEKVAGFKSVNSLETGQEANDLKTIKEVSILDT